MSSVLEIKQILQSSSWTIEPFLTLSTIAKACSKDADLGRDLVIRALEYRGELEASYRELLDELVMQVGLYPYIDELEELSLRNSIIHAAHRAEGVMEDYILHGAQARVLRSLLQGESVVLSAPTSFGKSLLIDVFIAIKDFSNIVLLVPTLALVEETRRRMARFSDKYSIITSSNQEVVDNNIFVLTQERYLAMVEDIPAVDFFVIDEFYKLSIPNDGGRSVLLNHALFRLYSTGAQFYLLGPSIKEIPEVVKSKLNCKFMIEDFQTVAIELNFLEKNPTKEERLATLLGEISGQTMIYCQSPASTRRLLRSYLDNINLKETQDQELIEAANWTSDNYHNDWLVSIALRYGIGIHHGRLPRSLGRFMVRAFEEGKIKLLLCTSTLIEGVNTSAKNVIIYDNKLNNKALDFFTFNNIKGRAGRMFQHFIGNIFLFDSPPEEQLPLVDIPMFNPDENTPSSLLINLPEQDIPLSVKDKINKLVNQSILPVSILKKHSGIEPEYLLATAEYLFSIESISWLEKFAWINRPQYDDVKLTSGVIWEYLGGAPSARQGSLYSADMMTYWIWKLYASGSVSRFRKEMINSQINEWKKSPDDAVENVLAFLRGWASFNYPKYLLALDDIVNYVLKVKGLRPCNYLPFATMIESLFQPSTFATLEEYGLPTEISEKLLKNRFFDKDDSFDIVVDSLRNKNLSRFGEGVFEKNVIKDFQLGIGFKLD